MKMSRIGLLLGLVAVAACQRQAPSAAGASNASEAAPVATINGTPISREFFEFYVKGISGGKSPNDLTAEQRELALDNLVRAQLVAQRAEQDGLLKEKETADMLELSRLNVLQQTASERYLKSRKPTEEELHAEYELQIAGLPHQEYHARHILVATETFARKLIEQLDKGANFADLAKRESMDSSKDNGGDLGWFTADRMVKPFASAVMALKPGEYTRTPIQTQYGWHVIRLDDTRPLTAPTYESVRQRLVQIVEQKKFRAYTDDLMKNAKIEKKI